MIYLDNAATSYPKPLTVIRALDDCVKHYCGNPGRSSHVMSEKAGIAIYETREAVAELFGSKTPEGVVFTYNATYAINIALKAFINQRCHIITSDIEHNAVIRPLEKLSNTLGVSYSIFSTDGDIRKNIEELIQPDTVCIISTLVSNVTGKEIPLSLLSDISTSRGLYLIADASQAAGHIDINLSETPCDVLCAPGHKGLFGIQGCGFAIFKDTKRLDSVIEGGSGSESRRVEMPALLPEGYEAGTLGTPSIVSLRAGIDFISRVGLADIREKTTVLAMLLRERLALVRGTVLYNSEGGIVSFNLGGLPSSLISSELNKHGVCARGGLHCAPSVHRKLGTLDIGAVRLSLSYFNSRGDVEQFSKIYRKIAAEYNI